MPINLFVPYYHGTLIFISVWFCQIVTEKAGENKAE